MDYGFKRLYAPPRKRYLYNPARAEYYLKQSLARFEKRDDAYIFEPPLAGEIGRIDSVRFIETS